MDKGIEQVISIIETQGEVVSLGRDAQVDEGCRTLPSFSSYPKPQVSLTSFYSEELILASKLPIDYPRNLIFL